MSEILKLSNLSKDYGIKGFKTRVLNNISLSVEEGEFLSIMGPSGAGKTTLLNLLSTLDKPTKGEILLDGIDVTKVKNKELSRLRKEKIGFIFQDYSLLDNMTLMDNIALPLALGRKKTKEIEEKVIKMADVFGLKEHLNKYPYELSGGQKQRGAAARALITEPRVIFADEPTGALDSKSSIDLLECLKKVNEENKATIIMVTHDAFCASYSKKIYMLSDGEFKCQLNRGQDRKEFYGKIIDLLATLGGAK
ncbi:polyamine-transporting ATPase [[Clostridium] sordellii]|jgi:putative ABC transport system ATP-binding protein|uniref:ABC transporter ATP-binding protein n=1 Tax=Paraclostridium sordellii TaxID=1505 RepID=UPI000385E4D5|nr:ABC transporter ATP-binding protein [Paeniclostridium sordellii]EPZ57792.1 ABC transporter family protein [[Clostridium] sordellii VPI 9048] [Paeniclostridium sordellii VPI 9048]CEK37635.1 ABC-type transport system, ATP-binding protein [[Clostridium] sordellii] [Paeniclostridium sordellii]CEQ30525.1 polyamine-transporting ATPase [[Clostridium] sordellii] [Paeniclostridium sordellii]